MLIAMCLRTGRRPLLSASPAWESAEVCRPRGNALPRSLSNQRRWLKSPELILRAKFENPLKFQWGTGGAEATSLRLSTDFDVTLLIDLSNAIIAAKWKGGVTRSTTSACRKAIPHHSWSIRQVRHSRVWSIASLVTTRPAEEVIEAFKLYV